MKTQIFIGLLFAIITGDTILADASTVAPAIPLNEPVTRPSGVTPQPDNTTQSDWAAWMIEGSNAAKEYVLLLDQGRYAESWSKGAKIFQGTISQNEWKTALNMARSRLGRATARSLKDQKPAWNPRGLPPGPYMVVEFNTSFEKAPHSGELLTLMREKDGKWKVLTYQVN